MTKIKVKFSVEPDVNPIRIARQDDTMLTLVEFDLDDGSIYRVETDISVKPFVNIVSREVSPDGDDMYETELTLSARQMEIIAAWYLTAISTCCKGNSDKGCCQENQNDNK